MPRFARRPIPRRALIAATLGAVYALLILPAPGTVLGISLPGLTWFVLSLSLLFVLPLAFHVYSAWSILWVLYRGVVFVRAGEIVLLGADLVLPLASLALLMTSGYLDVAQRARGRPPGD